LCQAAGRLLTRRLLVLCAGGRKALRITQRQRSGGEGGHPGGGRWCQAAGRLLTRCLLVRVLAGARHCASLVKRSEGEGQAVLEGADFAGGCVCNRDTHDADVASTSS
jgi:hypothetical protein